MSPLAPPRRSARGHPKPNQPPPRKKRKTNSPAASENHLRLAVRTETPVEPTPGEIERARAAAAAPADAGFSHPPAPSSNESAAAPPSTTSSVGAPLPLARHLALSLPPSTKATTQNFERLVARPVLRLPEKRASYGALNLEKPENRAAYVAQAVGNLAPSPCLHCTRSNGPWVDCVYASGEFLGSCANCHYNNSGGRCSLRSRKFNFYVSVAFGCFQSFSNL